MLELSIKVVKDRPELTTQAVKARAVLKFLVYNKATSSFVSAEWPNFVFVSFPIRRTGSAYVFTCSLSAGF